MRMPAAMMLAFVTTVAAAQTPSPASLWYNAGHVMLAVDDPAKSLRGEWEFDRADNGDVRIVKDEQRGARKVRGMLLSICEDHALLFNGIVPERRHELDELNAPVLYLQLVLRLLARAAPQGPSGAWADGVVEVRDDGNPIRVRKGYSVRRDFLAPWHARGRLAHTATGGAEFEFVLTHADGDAGERRSEVKLKGAWVQASRVRTFENAFALNGWKVHRLDMVINVVGGVGERETVAATTAQQFATLGDVRARIERIWSTAPRALRKMECKL